MDWSTQAKEAQARVISVFTDRPGQALSTSHGVATVTDGFLCTYEQDGQTVQVDMPGAVGGSGKAPTPGFYGRATICSCLAIGIRLTAVREGIPVASVSVSIDQDWDDRGLFAMGDSPPAPLDTRLTISVESPASPQVLEGLIHRAMASDPWLVAYKNAQPVTATISVVNRSR